MALFAKFKEGVMRANLADFDLIDNELMAYVVDMNDALYPGGAAGGAVITGVSNADPSTITTSAAHGLSVGDRVEIFGVAGATGVNGVHVVATVPTGTTFTVDLSAAPGVYSSGGFVADLSVTFLSEFVPAGGRVSSAVIPAGGKSVTNGVFDAADITFTNVPGPDPVEAVLITKSSATQGGGTLADTAQRCIYLNTPNGAGQAGLPLTPNGGNLDMTWNTLGLFSL